MASWLPRPNANPRRPSGPRRPWRHTYRGSMASAASCRSRKEVMKVLILVAASIAFTAAPLLAQSERGYVAGAGGFAISPDATSGDAVGEIGVRIAPGLMVFGDIGQFHNLQPSGIQPTVNSTTAMLSDS